MQSVYNTTMHATTAYTPFELVYGFKSEVPSAVRETPKEQNKCGDYLAELRGRLQSAHEFARQKLISSKERSMEYYDKNSEAMEIQTGQKVSLFDESVRRGGPKTLPPLCWPLRGVGSRWCECND